MFFAQSVDCKRKKINQNNLNKSIIKNKTEILHPADQYNNLNLIIYIMIMNSELVFY